MRTVDGLFVGNPLEIGPVFVADRQGLNPRYSLAWQVGVVDLGHGRHWVLVLLRPLH